MIRLLLLVLLSLLSIFGPSTLMAAKIDAAVDLNATNFDSFLKERKESFAIVEFFAHWCPACRNYKPHYEKVARVFNGDKAAHPGVVLMTRVDCALKVNTKLCDNYSVSHYPTLLWGPPLKFGSGWKPENESDIISIEDARSADLLLDWINKQLGSSYNFQDEKFEIEHILANASDLVETTKAVYDIEESTAMAFDIITEHKMIKPETRGSIITFLQLLVAHHPSKRCRKGSAEMLVNLDDLFPSTSLDNQDSNTHQQKKLEESKICGSDVPVGYWTFCRGSRNDTRGFSCGLWVLLHSLSVRIEDAESQFAFQATCEFIHNFFVCEECRQHFYEMCMSVSKPFTRKKDFVLWLWEAHNTVNERLMKDEANFGTGDPKFPKVLWPPKQLCSSCSFIKSQNATYTVIWNKDAVYMFLSHYYGKKMVAPLYNQSGVPLTNTTSLNAVEKTVVATNAAVPTWAVLAFALASCAFGALAWLWRLRKKYRKPWRN